MHEPVTVGEFIVNKAKYDALPTDLKEILKTTIQAAYWIHFVPFQEKDTKACGELIASGVKVIKTTDEFNNRFLKVYDEITNGYAVKGPFYKRLWTRRRSTRAWLSLAAHVLAAVQLHRRALPEREDLVEVAWQEGRPPSRPHSVGSHHRCRVPPASRT